MPLWHRQTRFHCWLIKMAPPDRKNTLKLGTPTTYVRVLGHKLSEFFSCCSNWQTRLASGAPELCGRAASAPAVPSVVPGNIRRLRWCTTKCVKVRDGFLSVLSTPRAALFAFASTTQMRVLSWDVMCIWLVDENSSGCDCRVRWRRPAAAHC